MKRSAAQAFNSSLSRPVSSNESVSSMGFSTSTQSSNSSRASNGNFAIHNATGDTTDLNSRTIEHNIIVPVLLNNILAIDTKIRATTSEECWNLINFINNPNNQHIFNRIEALQLGNINKDNQCKMQELLNLIAKKVDQFKNLTSFECGHMQETLKLPEELNSLISFKCGNIYYDGVLTLPKQFSSLSSFECGSIGRGATLTLPEQLNSLSSFKCGYIYKGAPLVLPDSFKNLKMLTIYKIENNGCLKLPKFLGYETILRITEIGDNVKIALSEVFFDQIISSRKIGNTKIGKNVAFILPTRTVYSRS